MVTPLSRFSLLLLSCLLLLTASTAWSATAITSGQTLTGTIAQKGQTLTYAFSAGQGNTVHIMLANASGVLQPDMTVIAPSGKNVANTSYPYGQRIIDQANLPMTGTYLIQIHDDSGNNTGTFTISLFSQQGTLPPNSLTLLSGDTKTTNFSTKGSWVVCSFAANAGDTAHIMISNVASGLQPDMALFAPDGSNVADTAYPYGQRIIHQANLPMTGLYVILVYDDSGAQTGSFTITMFKQPGILPPGSQTLLSGDLKNGAVAKGSWVVFSFAANKGDLVHIMITNVSTGLQPDMTLFAPDGTNVANAAYPYGQRFIHQADLPLTGTYEILIRDDSGSNAGTFMLTMFLQQGTLPPGSGPIATGQTKTGNVLLGSWLVYTFPAIPGDTIDIRIATPSATLQPDMMLFAPDGMNVANAAYPYGQYIIHQDHLPQTGTYALLIYDDTGSRTGNASVTFNRSCPHRTDLGIRIPGEASYTGYGIYNLTGTGQTKTQNTTAGSTVTYQVLVQNAGGSSDTILVSALGGGSGWTIKYYDAKGADITSAMTFTGWSTPVLASNTGTAFTVKVTPAATAAANDSNTLNFTAISKADADPTIQDMACAITTIVVPPTRFTVSPASGPNGTISPNTPQVVTSGGSFTFTAVANAGYTVDSWSLDNVVVQTGGATYTVKNVTANHGVKVTFKANAAPGGRGDWWMFHHDPQHTGRSAFNGPGSPKLLWTFQSGMTSFLYSPVVAADGTSYLVTENSAFYAVKKDGTLKWKATADRIVNSSPAMAPDGTVYFGYLGVFFAYNPDGTEKWRFYLNNSGYISPPTAPTIAPDGTIYLAMADNSLYALNPNGTLKWRLALTAGSTIYSSSPALGADGTIYIGSQDKNLYAVNPNGTLKWCFTTGGKIDSSPAVGADGTIYVDAWDGYLYAITATGTKKWATQISSYVTSVCCSSPAIGKDGVIYIGSPDQHLYAINPDGTKKWACAAGAIDSSPAIGADGVVYFGSDDNNLTAVNPDGTKRWTFATGGAVTCSPAITADGTLLFGSSDGLFYAVGSGTTFTITPTAGPNGTIAPNTPQSVASGGSATFTAAANAGYTVDCWTLDSATVQTGGTAYTVKNVTANHAVKVTFKALTPPALTLKKTVSPGSVVAGGMVTYTLTYGNTGGTATNVTLTDALPAQMTYAAGSGSAAYNTATNTLIWTLGTVNARASGLSVSFKAVVKSTILAGTNIVNTATIYCTEVPKAVASNAVTVIVMAPPPIRQPDLLIRTPSENAYAGGGIYNLDGTGQTKSTWIAGGVAAVYFVRIQNAGNSTDSYLITAPSGGSGWKIDYYDLATGMALTTAITGTGWKTGPLAVGAKLGFYVQILPGIGLTPGAVNTLAITAVSVNDTTKKDAVKGVTTSGDVGLRVR